MIAFLTLKQRLLGLSALGYILSHTNHPRKLSEVVSNRHHPLQYPANRSVGRNNAKLLFKPAGVLPYLDGLIYPFVVLGIYVIKPGPLGTTVNLLKGGIDVKYFVCLSIQQEEGLPHVLRHLAKSLLAFPQGFFRPLAISNVYIHPDNSAGLALTIVDELGPSFNPTDLSIRPYEAEL